MSFLFGLLFGALLFGGADHGAAVHVAEAEPVPVYVVAIVTGLGVLISGFVAWNMAGPYWVPMVDAARARAQAESAAARYLQDMRKELSR